MLRPSSSRRPRSSCYRRAGSSPSTLWRRGCHACGVAPPCLSPCALSLLSTTLCARPMILPPTQGAWRRLRIGTPSSSSLLPPSSAALVGDDTAAGGSVLVSVFGILLRARWGYSCATLGGATTSAAPSQLCAGGSSNLPRPRPRGPARACPIRFASQSTHPLWSHGCGSL